MIYKPKALVTGYKLGLDNANLYVAVPSKHFNNGRCAVRYGDSLRRIYFKNRVLGLSQTFNDKFSEGTYTLEYFKWKTRDEKPIEQVDRSEYLNQMSKLAEIAREKCS